MGEKILRCLNCGEEFNDLDDLLYMGPDDEWKIGHCPSCTVDATGNVKAVEKAEKEETG